MADASEMMSESDRATLTALVARYSVTEILLNLSWICLGKVGENVQPRAGWLDAAEGAHALAERIRV